MLKKVVVGTICLVFLIVGFYAYINYPTTIYTGPKIDYDIKPIIEVEDVKELSEWIPIPTYENSGEVTHPKVLYFKNGVSGYKYWMVATPYPFNDAYYENPSILVSNDGSKFIEPSGIKNPVSGYPNPYRDDAYYSDPFMLYDKDHFELFFRKTKSVVDGVVKRDGYNYMLYQTSKDGINWSEPEVIFKDNPPERYMSMSVVKNNGLYKIWYINYEGNIRYVESRDLKEFSKPIDIKVNNFDKFIWHGEIQYVDGKYVFVFLIRYKIYYCESIDGINFSEPKLINTDLDELKGVIHHIYKSTFIIGRNKVELYVPYRVNYVWKMRHIVMTKDNFYKRINSNK